MSDSPHTLGTGVLSIEVAYASPTEQSVVCVSVPQGATIESAILASNVCAQFPEIDVAQNKVGVFGCVLPLSHTLLDGDRVEIYRPLEMDPKKARTLRVLKGRKHQRRFT